MLVKSNAFEGDEIRLEPSYSLGGLRKLTSLCRTNPQDKKWEGQVELTADDVISFCLDHDTVPDKVNGQSEHLFQATANTKRNRVNTTFKFRTR